MAFLTIGDKEYEAKVTFKFDRVANEKYASNEDEMNGFMSIYLGLLQYDNSSILNFWDCALAHLKKDKPSKEAIEEALEERIEQDGDTDALFREAFQALDWSGFYKKQVTSIWHEFMKPTEAAKDETDEQKQKREEHEEMAKMMRERRAELTA
ncbi:tail assembly chaperone [Salibacterium lacus]|uniref:Tail assembly chaperone n=1 Tax=Salibacterium lacus TaxID=1898109 RepID=A0ABW5SWW3_9BACI